MRTPILVAAASVVVSLSACSGFRPGPDPQETRLEVPYHSDRREQWGPAAVADVLSFYGHEVDLKALRRAVHFTRKPEDVALELQEQGRALGFKAELGKADLPAIKRELDAGRPVVALVNIGFGWVPVRAYMVITGYSERRRCVYAHWGPYRDHYVSYRQFESDWRSAGGALLRISSTGRPAVAAAPRPEAAAPPPPEAAPRPPEGEPPVASERPMPDYLWLSP